MEDRSSSTPLTRRSFKWRAIHVSSSLKYNNNNYNNLIIVIAVNTLNMTEKPNVSWHGGRKFFLPVMII